MLEQLLPTFLKQAIYQIVSNLKIRLIMLSKKDMILSAAKAISLMIYVLLSQMKMDIMYFYMKEEKIISKKILIYAKRIVISLDIIHKRIHILVHVLQEKGQVVLKAMKKQKCNYLMISSNKKQILIYMYSNVLHKYFQPKVRKRTLDHMSFFFVQLVSLVLLFIICSHFAI